MLSNDHFITSSALPWQVCVQQGTIVKEEPLMQFHMGHQRSLSVGPALLDIIVLRALLSQLPAQLGP